MGQTHGWLFPGVGTVTAAAAASSNTDDRRATGYDRTHLSAFFSKLHPALDPPLPKFTFFANNPASCQALAAALYDASSGTDCLSIARELRDGNKTKHWAWWAFPTCINDRRSAQGARYQFVSDNDALLFTEQDGLCFALATILFVIAQRVVVGGAERLATLLGDDAVKLKASCTFLVHAVTKRNADQLSDNQLLLLTLCHMLFRLAFGGQWLQTTLDNACGGITSRALDRAVCRQLGIAPDPSLINELTGLMEAHDYRRRGAPFPNGDIVMDSPSIIFGWLEDLHARPDDAIQRRPTAAPTESDENVIELEFDP